MVFINALVIAAGAVVIRLTRATAKAQRKRHTLLKSLYSKLEIRPRLAKKESNVSHTRDAKRLLS